MKILRLVSSFRGKESMSLQLGNVILDKIKDQNPNATVTTRYLTNSEVPHLNSLHFTAFRTPSEHLSPELKLALSYSDEAVKELQTADVVVIDVPMYNFGIPSPLKAWIDHVVRAGITFKYTESGVEGMVKDKKIYLSIATGGVYSNGPMKDYDFTEPYLKTILGFIGLIDITTFRVEGTAIPGIQENAFANALDAIANHTF